MHLLCLGTPANVSEQAILPRWTRSLHRDEARQRIHGGHERPFTPLHHGGQQHVAGPRGRPVGRVPGPAPSPQATWHHRECRLDAGDGWREACADGQCL
eukprot:3935350-Rhodomonas_salina.2